MFTIFRDQELAGDFLTRRDGKSTSDKNNVVQHLKDPQTRSKYSRFIKMFGGQMTQVSCIWNE